MTVLASERKAQFLKELKELVQKWDTEIILEEEGRGYTTQTTMKCYLDGVYESGECVAEFTEIDLGTYID